MSIVKTAFDKKHSFFFCFCVTIAAPKNFKFGMVVNFVHWNNSISTIFSMKTPVRVISYAMPYKKMKNGLQISVFTSSWVK